MSSMKISLPCSAYTGKEPYLFISYAHDDRERVYPEIKTLYDRGYRIWYDEGIGPSKKWLEEIAAAIDGSAMFMVFITRNSITSDYVDKEVVYAINDRKCILPVYLEETSVPKGWKLGLGNIQAILKWQISEEDYARKMRETLPGECLEKVGRVVTKEPFPEISVTGGFVFIQGGEFLMGSPEREVDRSNNETQHPVRLDDFYIAKYPITVAEFESFVRESNYPTDADQGRGSFVWNGKEWGKRPGVNWRCDTQGEIRTVKRHPVLHVSWNDAVAYCEWLSKKLKGTFRLPTEAEWEYACRAGTDTPFHTGNNLTTEQANYNGNYPYNNNPKGKYNGTTTPVGSYTPNTRGLYDMHGNVWEWCRDWYGKDYYDDCKKQGVIENPLGPKTGSDRVLRGGSWFFSARGCRSACRPCYDPDDRGASIGFRLVFVP